MRDSVNLLSGFRAMVYLIGLCGAIACGKTAVSCRLKDAGIPIVDADEITHRLYSNKQGRMHKKVVATFGKTILAEDGTVDRQKLSEIVFANPVGLRALNKATHGPIMQTIVWEFFILLLKGHRRIAFDIPLLIKFPKVRRFILSTTVVVSAPKSVQFARLISRNGYSEEEAQRRIDQQASAEEQCRMADIVLDNSGNLDDLDQKVSVVLRDMPRGLNMYEGCCIFGIIIVVISLWLHR